MVRDHLPVAGRHRDAAAARRKAAIDAGEIVAAGTLQRGIPVRYQPVAGRLGTRQRRSSSAPARMSWAGDGKPAQGAWPIGEPRTAPGLLTRRWSIRAQYKYGSAESEQKVNMLRT